MRQPADYSALLNPPVADRLALIEQLWDSVADSTADAPLHPAIAAELQDRLRKHEADPGHAHFTADDRRLTVLLVFHTAQDSAKVFGRLTSH